MVRIKQANKPLVAEGHRRDLLVLVLVQANSVQVCRMSARLSFGLALRQPCPAQSRESVGVVESRARFNHESRTKIISLLCSLCLESYGLVVQELD